MNDTVRLLSEVSADAQKAMELIAAIKPGAKKEYAVDRYGRKLCNNLYLDDCKHRANRIDGLLSAAGRDEEAKIAHKIPLFVFAMLDEEETIEFIHRWKEAPSHE